MRIKHYYIFLAVLMINISCNNQEKRNIRTEITKWQHGKNAAVSLTYDDGTINQFRKALPIMNNLELPATFYIVTGEIPGSEYKGKFIGRPVEEIIKETEKTPTNQDNFFERASAVGFLGYEGTQEYHTMAGQLYEQEKIEEAYRHIDEAYEKVRKGALKPKKNSNQPSGADQITWAEIKEIASQGHEFGSHTVTHPRLAVLDEVNMLYELEKSKEDILNQLGEEHTFSAEGPYGTEDERVMEYAYEIYPSLRNRMPHPFLEELNRGNKMAPGNSDKEYVQWQRGPLTATPMELMKSWVDTLVVHDNIWLVLVFHGVDGIGWEAKPSKELQEYFNYIKDQEEKLWVATFKDVTKYIRQRMDAVVEAQENNGKIEVKLTHSLNKDLYNIPLTLKTYLPARWGEINVKQGNKEQRLNARSDEGGSFILYQALPNSESIEISEL